MRALDRFRKIHDRYPIGPGGVCQSKSAYHRRQAMGILIGALATQHRDVRQSFSFSKYFPERFPRHGMAGYWSYEAAQENKLAKLAGFYLP